MFCVSLLPDPSVASPTRTPRRSMSSNRMRPLPSLPLLAGLWTAIVPRARDALDVVVGEPDAMRHRDAIVEEADLVEMSDRGRAEQLAPLEELPLGLADVDVDHGIEFDRELGQTAQHVVGAAMGRRRSDDRQDEIGALAHGFGEGREIVEGLRAFHFRNAVDLLARRCRHASAYRCRRSIRTRDPTRSAPARRACRRPPWRRPRSARPCAGSASRCRNDPSRWCSRCGSSRRCRAGR